ncbi:hypothetical protein AVEN_163511-1 [Araneus ventricosus]|uniref:Uncharacterized protein n=1 Tax=Araneus ventricosus TaxID=182803 RepID=A0A4Y2BRX5_ARAVE|nr:hypothetical protein AVEN_163511-1 [Araneus ventricosus]
MLRNRKECSLLIGRSFPLLVLAETVRNYFLWFHSALVVDLNGPYAPFGFESIEKQLWRNKQNGRPISDSEIKAVLSQLFKTDQWLPPAGHVSGDVTSHA